jgi:DNA-binding transcriptional MerR regulator
MTEANLKVLQVAKHCDCCRNTVRNYTDKGIIKSMRDIHGRRRYSRAEAEKLRQLLGARWPESNKQVEKP